MHLKFLQKSERYSVQCAQLSVGNYEYQLLPHFLSWVNIEWNTFIWEYLLNIS